MIFLVFLDLSTGYSQVIHSPGRPGLALYVLDTSPCIAQESLVQALVSTGYAQAIPAAWASRQP